MKSFAGSSAKLALVGLLVIVTGCNNDLTTPTPRASIEVTRLASRVSLNDAIDPQLSVGILHVCALKTAGTVICWGDEEFGQLAVPADLGVVTEIAAGGHHTCAVQLGGTVACWGNNDIGQHLPPGLTSVAHVAAGIWATCAVRTDGTVVCSGRLSDGRAAQVPAGLSSVVQVSIGWYDICAIKTDGTVTCWGETGLAKVPVVLKSVSQISVGMGMGCAVRTEGSGVCWGGFGGSGSPDVLGIPLAQLDAWNGTSVCGVTMYGKVFCTEYDWDLREWSAPAGLPGLIDVLQIARGGTQGGVPQACALKKDGTVDCWSSYRPVPEGLNLIKPDWDTDPPVIERVPNIFAEATSFEGTNVGFTLPTATDLVGVVSVECSHRPGLFPLGTTVVSCVALDAAGNGATTEFTINVFDTTAPTLILPANITVDATSTGGAAVNYSVDASDAVGLLDPVSCTPPSGGVFAVGTTTVSCSVSDRFGNSARNTFTVTVKDAATQVADLQIAVKGLVLQEGTETSVQAKLTSALTALASGNTTSACGSLNALINQVNAQTGKKITAAQAAELLANVRRVTATAGC